MACVPIELKGPTGRPNVVSQNGHGRCNLTCGPLDPGELVPPSEHSKAQAPEYTGSSTLVFFLKHALPYFYGASSASSLNAYSPRVKR
jgi:hypothetical protein